MKSSSSSTSQEPCAPPMPEGYPYDYAPPLKDQPPRQPVSENRGVSPKTVRFDFQTPVAATPLLPNLQNPGGIIRHQSSDLQVSTAAQSFPYIQASPAAGYGHGGDGDGSSWGGAYYPYYPTESNSAMGYPILQESRRHQRRPTSGWTTGLCDCFADIPVCLGGFFCPCLLLGKNIQILDSSGDVDDDDGGVIGLGSCLAAGLIWYLLQQFTACGWIYSCGFRKKLRAKYGLPQSPLPDCLVHFLCWHCAFCQEHRELRFRRLVEEAQWSTTLLPPEQQSMRF